MKFSCQGIPLSIGFRYENPALLKLIKEKQRLFDIMGKTPWDLNKGELMQVLGIKVMPAPKVTRCYLRTSEGQVLAETESSVHPMDVFDKEEARTKCIKRLSEKFPGAQNRELRRAIWESYWTRNDEIPRT